MLYFSKSSGFLIKIWSTDRSIKEILTVLARAHMDATRDWWKGLGKELEVDIETLTEKNL